MRYRERTALNLGGHRNQSLRRGFWHRVIEQSSNAPDPQPFLGSLNGSFGSGHSRLCHVNPQYQIQGVIESARQSARLAEYRSTVAVLDEF
ncbi:Uncharacterised protein [Vibrio cholerae]|uniref:Uncharacterized protein n=1 Tax=Vibrio cholerae TaxID=666 RepID=A0A655YJB2_VIBCL|nr:Uncharacterised protein [Vibrio cholerae]